ncbi:MAG TPA: hypothetical protein ENI51_01095, partial [Candidatus Atribacteria bacterium]|nr:hypothetical protein [Candidatus Atribacteria bacterium]
MEDVDNYPRKGLLDKAIDKKNEEVSAGKSKESSMKIIEEKKGFGWKGLGIRRITLDEATSEYYYEVLEPELTDHEKEIKKELSHLFKMLADVNVTGLKKEEKKKYLEETLEQIIIDNDITFYPKKSKENKEKSVKNILSFIYNRRSVSENKHSEDKHKESPYSKEKFSLDNILHRRQTKKN